MGRTGLRLSRLKVAVMAPFITFVVILAMSVGAAEYLRLRRDHARLVSEAHTAIEASFNGAVTSETAMLRSVAEAVAANDGLKAAFRARDRQRLRAQAEDLFAKLRATGNITHLYFTGTDRVNVLRAHQPERFGDVIDRVTTLRAEHTGATAAGIELGPLGTLTLRVVVPWKDGGTLLGYIETGKEIEPLFTGLREQFSVQPLVFIPKNRLNRQNWEDGMRMLGRQAKWDEFADMVVSVRAAVPGEVLRHFLGLGSAAETELGERWYRWMSLDVPDASGERAAMIGVVMDVSDRHQEVVRFATLLAAIGLLGTAVVVVVLWLVIDRVERELERNRTQHDKSEALYHSLFSSANAVMLLIDPVAGAVVDANAEAGRFYGYSHDRMIGLRISDINTLPAEQVGVELELARRGEKTHFFFRHRLANGDIREVESHTSTIEVGGRTLVHAVIHDVTERRRSEETIRDLHRRLSQLLDAASEVSIIATDANGVITVFNTGAERMLGYTAAEVVGKHTPDLFHDPDEVAAAAAALGLAGATAPVNFASYATRESWTYVTKDGHRLVVSLAVTKVHDDNGQLTGYLGVAQDITQRKRTEQRLKESEERFRSLIESTTDWVWETDEEHRFTWLSSSMLDCMGIVPETLVGKRRWDLASVHHEIDASRWQGYMEDLKARRPFRDFRYWIGVGGEKARWISVSGAPRFDEHGNFLGYRGSGADVTAYAEVSLRLRTMSKVVEQSPMSVLITDPQGYITYVNPHFTSVTGYAADEVVGRTPAILASGETPREVYKQLWAAITSGLTWSGEMRNRRKDGSLHWESQVIFPVTNEEGLLAYYVSIKEDVTERKQAEARLVEALRRIEGQAAELERINGELEQFAYVASHDLRQPLRMVSSYLGLVARRLEGQMTEELREFLDFAIDGAKRMDHLILDLLEYSRTGRNAGPPEPVNLAEAVADSLVNLHVAVTEAEAEIVVADGLPTIQGDRAELVRLFQNLIGNAVKYRAPDRKPQIEVGWREEDERWVVWVKDNGIGMAPEHHDRAFQIFQRMVTPDKVEGSGIGLAICKKVVGNMGGRIWIESAEGEGSTFFVAFRKG